MVTTRGKRMKMSREAMPESGWKTLANLEPRLVENIFRAVARDDLLASVSLVCPSWRSACCEFLFWNRDVLDLSATGYTANSPVRVHDSDSDLATVGKGFFGRFKDKEDYKAAAMNLYMLLEHIMEGDESNRSSVAAWRKTIHTVFLPYELQISNEHILYIAKRTPFIKHLILLDPTRITGGGFAKAIQYWKNLRELHIGEDMKCDALKFKRFIEEAGRCCRYLQVLHIHHPEFRVNRANSKVIAKNLPKLKTLDFNHCQVCGSGIIVFSHISSQLKKICFYDCRRVLYDDYIADEYLAADERRLSGGESFALVFTRRMGDFKDFRLEYEGGVEPYVPFDEEDDRGFDGVFSDWVVAWSFMD